MKTTKEDGKLMLVKNKRCINDTRWMKKSSQVKCFQ